MAKEKSPGVIISLFKRKGAEGEFTRIITEQNAADYVQQLSGLDAYEKGLIIYRKNDRDWVLLTNKRIMAVKDDDHFAIAHGDLIKVDLARKEELEHLGASKLFTRLALTNRDGTRYVVQLEPGRAFNGFSQVLYFIESAS